MHALSRSMHITVAAFRIYAQHGEDVAKRGGWKPCKIMEITLLIMENHEKIMELCFQIFVGTREKNCAYLRIMCSISCVHGSSL